MKNFKNRYLSLILALILVILPLSSLPIGATEVEETENYEYTIPTEIISEENIELYGHKERFYKGEENMNEIRLINEDGTVSAYMFDYPVKYIDDDGITKDKSNKLHESKRSNYLYVNDDNDIKTYFPKKITKKPVILAADGFEIEMGIVTDSNYPKKGEVTKDNYVFYDQAFGENTAIRYRTEFNGYKEEIILKNAKAPTEYSFEIKCEGLYIVKRDGILKFISEVNDVEVFSTDPFYIYDSSENVNEYVDTEYTFIRTGDSEYLVTITLDEDYLNTEGLTYPVYVDPSVQYDCYDSIGMEDAFIYSGKPTTSYGYDNKGYLGYTSTYGIGRYLIRFPSLVTASDIFTANKIISANLYVYNYAYGTKSATAYAYQYDVSTTNWSESSATWNNVGTPTFSGTSAIGSLSYSTSTWCPFDVTAIAKTWVGNTTLAQKGLIIKSTNESNANYAKQICAEEDAPLSGGPYLLINYTQIIPDGVYYIQSNENNSWYIDGSVSASGSYAEIGDFDAEKSKYEIKRESDGYYSIKSVYTGNYLQVEDHSSSTGAKITYYGWYTRNGTKWMFNQLSNGSYTISARCGEGKVISIASSGDGLVQQSYTSGTDYCDEWNIICMPGTTLSKSLSEWITVQNDNTTAMSKVGMWLYSPKVYVDTSGISSSVNLSGYVDQAINLWNNALDMNIERLNSSSSGLADIVIYGVTRESYYSKTKSEWDNTLVGKTIVPQNTALGCYIAEYNNQQKNIHVLSKNDNIVIYVLCEDNSYIQTTVSHEIGHSLGFFGHSTETASILYYGDYSINYYLTIRDIDHLKQLQRIIIAGD